jgi:hypothetical protein
MSTLEALLLSNGWEGYMEISKEDYEQIISAQ